MAEKNTQQDKKLESGIFGTAKIDPDEFSPSKNTDMSARTKYAVAGLIHALVQHGSIRSLVIGTFISIVVAAILQISILSWAILILALGGNWLAEIINTAIEAVVDLTTEGGIHPLAKVAKDVAASGSLVMFIVTVLVEGLLFIPQILKLL